MEIKIQGLPSLHLDFPANIPTSLNSVGVSEKTTFSTLDKACIGHSLMDNNLLPPDEFLALQKSDKYCNMIIEKGVPHPFCVNNKILHKTIANSQSIKYVPVIPECLINEILNMIHVDYGHPTVNGFIKTFRTFYFYPSAKKMIQKLIGECLVCTKTHFRKTSKNLNFFN